MPAKQSSVIAETKRVGIWIRVSTEDQAKGESPEHHEKRARFYAESKEWQVREVYHLEAVSGKSVMGQPETQRMLEDVKSGRITGLIFSKLARLARNTKELLHFADYFREHRADLISLQEAIDTSSPAGRFFYTVIAAMAEWEREEIAERVAASVPIRAKLGKPLGGAAPFGYRWDKRELVPDQKEAPIRRLIYELFLEHRRIKTVARLLNERGHRTRNGSKFTDTTVSRLLRDPTAKGVRRANYTRSLGDKKHWVMKPEDEWVLIPVEPVVPAEFWDQCNEILDARRRSGKPPARRTVHLFAGLAFCACGTTMYVPSNSQKYVCSKCRNKIGIEDLEAVFEEQLKNLFLSPEELLKYLGEADKTIKQKQELLGTLETEARKVKAEMDHTYRLYLDGNLTSDGFGKRYHPRELRLNQLEDQIPTLQGEIDFLKIQYLSKDQIFAEAKDLYSRWQSLDHNEKRRIVENISERLVVGKDDITIELCYLPNLSEIASKGQRNVIPALPFCGLTLRTQKPTSPSYPKSLTTIGDHIRKRRLDLGLTQKQVAARFGVKAMTLWHWENNATTPSFKYWETIRQFLAYDPLPTPKTFCEMLVHRRKLLGISQKRAAEQLGVDPSTLGRWERGEGHPSAWHGARIDVFLNHFRNTIWRGPSETADS